MALQARFWVVAGSLLLGLAQSASAQYVAPGEVLDVPVSTRLLMTFHNQAAVPWYVDDIPMSTRLLRAFRSETAPIPGSFVNHYGGFLPYPGPPEFYGPGAMAPGAPALEPVQATTLTLRSDAALPAAQVKPDTVVTWVNAGDQERTLVIETLPSSAGSTWTGRQTGTISPNGSLALVFHQPGSYQYYLQDQPANRARIDVAP